MQIHTNTVYAAQSYCDIMHGWEWYETAWLCNGTIRCTFSSHRLVHNKLIIGVVQSLMILCTYVAPFFVAEADFVGKPLLVGDRAYFFYREIAVEHISEGNVVYSRVARVCKVGAQMFHTISHNSLSEISRRFSYMKVYKVITLGTKFENL